MFEEIKRTQLRRCYDPDELGMTTTDDLPDASAAVGQPRAVSAIQFGTGMTSRGYNIFAFGEQGTAKRELVAQLLAERSSGRQRPPDLCYVHNFAEPHRPLLLAVPAGEGAGLRSDMDRLIDELQPALAAAFEAEPYRRRREAITNEVKQRLERSIGELNERAHREGLALVHTPMGIICAPLKGDEPMSEEDFQKLPEEEQTRLKARFDAFQEELAKVLRQMPDWQREHREKVRQLDREVVRDAVAHLVAEVRSKHGSLANAVAHLDVVEKDLIENARHFLSEDTSTPAEVAETLRGAGIHRGALRRYQVNLLVDHAATSGAPVVFEDNPTYDNLLGRIDYVSQMGALVTDFNLIRPGALHRANGGFLVLDALRLLRAPFAWDALKLALTSGRIRLQPLAQMLGYASTASLEPEALALDVRVVLIGEPWMFYLLSAYDPDMPELFKVAADFAEDLDATAEARPPYLGVLATLARRDGLRPFDKTAMARLLEESARLAGAQDRLSIRLDRVMDVMREADYWAREEKADRVLAPHVDQAVAMQVYRANRLHERHVEETKRGIIMIDTGGAKVGQLNGLSVVPLGDFAFGQASRITARVRVGRGDLVDIEREVELGGPIHSKGVLILAAFLQGRYSLEFPLSLQASLVFEQSYEGVEGDSASAAELIALLSAVAGIPLRQCVAVTGSVNQRGEVQPVGAINEKIEGFFDLCRSRGLTGEHGVLMPRANLQHLMLRRDVGEAVEAGQFHVYAMATIDEGIELLTGLPAGERNEMGEFPAGSFNQLVELRLEEFAEIRRAFESRNGFEEEPSQAPIEVVRH